MKCTGYLESSITISIKGAATNNIIYQIADITVNIYDILIYHEWHFKRKRKKNQKRKRIDIRVNIFINNIYIFNNTYTYKRSYISNNNNIYNILYI